MTNAFMNAFCEAFAHAQHKPWVVLHPTWNALTLFNYLEFKLGNVTDGLRYNHVSASLENPSGSQSEIDWDLKG